MAGGDERISIDPDDKPEFAACYVILADIVLVIGVLILILFLLTHC